MKKYVLNLLLTVAHYQAIVLLKGIGHSMKQYVYQNDINLINSLYESDFWKIIKEDAAYYHKNNKFKKDNAIRILESLIKSIYVILMVLIKLLQLKCKISITKCKNHNTSKSLIILVLITRNVV